MWFDKLIGMIDEDLTGWFAVYRTRTTPLTLLLCATSGLFPGVVTSLRRWRRQGGIHYYLLALMSITVQQITRIRTKRMDRISGKSSSVTMMQLL